MTIRPPQVKLFGVQRCVENGSQDAPQRGWRQPRLALHPDSTARHGWETFIAISAVMSCVELPFTVAFIAEPSDALVAFGLATDLLMAADIFVVFCTAFVHEQDQIVWDHKAIACRYLRSWFVTDLISVLPMDRLAAALRVPGAESLRVQRLLRATRLFRAIHRIQLPRLLRCVGLWVVGGEQISSHSKLRVVRLCITTLFFIHWNSCLQYLVPVLEGMPADSWIFGTETPLVDEALFVRYTHSFFRALSHMLCTVH